MARHIVWQQNFKLLHSCDGWQFFENQVEKVEGFNLVRAGESRSIFAEKPGDGCCGIFAQEATGCVKGVGGEDREDSRDLILLAKFRLKFEPDCRYTSLPPLQLSPQFRG